MPDKPSPLAVRNVLLCARCRRELIHEVTAKANGTVTVVFRCPKHGANPGQIIQAYQ